MIGPILWCIAGKDWQAMADPEGADHFSVMMDMFDEFDSCLRSQANGLGIEWPFKNMAQIFSKLSSTGEAAVESASSGGRAWQGRHHILEHGWFALLDP
jgi:hypothetical protein